MELKCCIVKKVIHYRVVDQKSPLAVELCVTEEQNCYILWELSEATPLAERVPRPKVFSDRFDALKAFFNRVSNYESEKALVA